MFLFSDLEFIFRGGFPSKLMQNFGMLQKLEQKIEMFEIPIPNTVFRLVPTCPTSHMSSCLPGHMHPCGSGFGGPILQAAPRFFRGCGPNKKGFQHHPTVLQNACWIISRFARGFRVFGGDLGKLKQQVSSDQGPLVDSCIEEMKTYPVIWGL